MLREHLSRPFFLFFFFQQNRRMNGQRWKKRHLLNLLAYRGSSVLCALRYVSFFFFMVQFARKWNARACSSSKNRFHVRVKAEQRKHCPERESCSLRTRSRCSSFRGITAPERIINRLLSRSFRSSAYSLRRAATIADIYIKYNRRIIYYRDALWR